MSQRGLGGGFPVRVLPTEPDVMATFRTIKPNNWTTKSPVMPEQTIE